jgi:ribonuclease HI
VKGNQVTSPSRTAFSIKAITSNVAAAQSVVQSQKIPWQKHPAGSYKMNVDAFFFQVGSGAAAAVIRNYKGEAVAGGSWLLNNVYDASTAETIALQKGLIMLENIGCNGVIMESDSLELIQACTDVNEVLSPATVILANCFQRATRLSTVSFQHCPRDANRAAHNLARHAYDSKVVVFWDGDPPSFLLPDIIFDVTVI